jgi:hypothetical protein
MNLAAGSYIISAKLLIFNTAAFTRTAKCVIWNGAGAVTAENSALDFGLNIYTTEASESVMSLLTPLTLASPGTVTVQCVSPTVGGVDGVVGVNRIKMVAVQTGSLTLQ